MKKEKREEVLSEYSQKMTATQKKPLKYWKKTCAYFFRPDGVEREVTPPEQSAFRGLSLLGKQINTSARGLVNGGLNWTGGLPWQLNWNITKYGRGQRLKPLKSLYHCIPNFNSIDICSFFFMVKLWELWAKQHATNVTYCKCSMLLKSM